MRVMLVVLGCLLALQPVAAIESGEYYYVISDRCQSVGLTEKEEDALTPDVRLFDIQAARISDYNVHINTDALSSYSEVGADYLQQLQQQQVYSVGMGPAPDKYSIHTFLLQRETLSYGALAYLLNNFSQSQLERGKYYKALLQIEDKQARFRAVTRIRLTDVRIPQRVLLSEYVSEYFQLDSDGSVITPAAITVDHREGLTADLHDAGSRWQRLAEQNLCGFSPGRMY